jgi:hypothetical protein
MDNSVFSIRKTPAYPFPNLTTALFMMQAAFGMILAVRIGLRGCRVNKGLSGMGLYHLVLGY